MKVTNEPFVVKGNREEINGHFCDNKQTYDCPITDVLARLSDKWTMHTMIILGKAEKLRFTEIKNEINGISQRMLTVTLRTLEEDGLVTRKVYPQIPPKVEYQLTALGRSLVSQLIGLSKWANENMTHIFEARSAYQKNSGS